MKKIKILFLTLGVLSIFLVMPLTQTSAQQLSVSFQIFYNQLSPYGQWVDDPDYGYIWIPDADPDFFPYATSGHWVLTEYGWTWVSDYVWGWAPFHYGRWDWDISFGWYWIPDEVWGPAWVVWRSGSGCYGWAPMPPHRGRGFYYNRYRIPPERWMFVRDRDFTRDDLYRYYVRKRDKLTIIVNSTVIENTHRDRHRNVTYNSGPRREDVERVTGTDIRQLPIHDSDRPGQNLRNDRLQIYRPNVKKYIVGERRPAPSRFYNADDFREPSNQNYRREQRESRQDNEPRNIQRRQQQETGAPSTGNERREQRSTRKSTNQSDIQRKQQPGTVAPSTGNERREQPSTQQKTNTNIQRRQPAKPAKETEQQKEEKRERRR